MKFTIRKTTTAETSGGFHSKTCYFRGNSVKWSIDHDDLDGVAYYHTKKDAVDVCAFANDIDFNMCGDITARFTRHLAETKQHERLEKFRGEA